MSQSSESSDPMQASPPVARRQLLSFKAVSCLVFLGVVVSFFLPFGAFHSMVMGSGRGATACAHPGCIREATVHVRYGFPAIPAGQRLVDPATAEVLKLPPAPGLAATTRGKIGFCEEHAAQAPKTIKDGRPRGSGRLGMATILSLVFFLVLLSVALAFALVGEVKERFCYVLVAVAEIVLVNAYWYWQWLYQYHSFNSM